MMEFTIERDVLKECQGDAVIVEIPKGVREIGYGAFRNCRSMQQLAVPVCLHISHRPLGWQAKACLERRPAPHQAGCQEIQSPAEHNIRFRNCRSMQQLAVPASVQRIGSQAFAGCEGLESVELAEGIKEIGYSAFENCVKLKKVVLPSGLVSLERLAFAGCYALLEIEFPDTLLDVGRDAGSSAVIRTCVSASKHALPITTLSHSSSTFNFRHS